MIGCGRRGGLLCALHLRRPMARSLALAGSNPQLNFPCLDQREQKTASLKSSGKAETNAGNSLLSGPEPSYAFVQSGFSVFKSDTPIVLDHGGTLPEYEIAYETWGVLDETRSNAILIHTGLLALSHARLQPDNLKPGWWEKFIGPGLYIDTDKFFVVCTNVLGGCYGSTGPSLRDPADGLPYATRFPIITVNDMVRAQRQLMSRQFGIKKLHASVGASMGGMQSLAYAWEFPDEVEKVVSILGCARLHPYSIALRHTQRQVLMSDPNWNRGFYYGKVPPHVGMKLAREIATVTYRLGPEWEYRFGRNRADSSRPPALCPDFLVETYLDHAGEKFCLEYDANSLLYVLKAMDLFDLGATNRAAAAATKQAMMAGSAGSAESEPSTNCATECGAVPQTPYEERADSTSMTAAESLGDLARGMAKIAHKDIMVVGVESDILFPVWQQREIAEVLKLAGRGGDIQYFELGNEVSNYGHDTFLLSLDHIGPPVKSFLEGTS